MPEAALSSRALTATLAPVVWRLSRADRLTLWSHILLALCWVLAAAAISVQIAMLGGQEHQISLRRGAIEREMDQIQHDQQQLSGALDVAGSQPRLERLIRQLHLPVRPPAEVAARERAR
jgi:hypothetical protein